MARKQTPTLTEAELRLMKVLWDVKEASVTEVMEQLPEDLNLAYNSVLTTLRILETKGYLSHKKSGRAHIYYPLVTKKQTRSNVVKHMMSSFFNDSPELLLLSLFDNDDLTKEDINKLKEMIKQEGE